MLRPAEPLLSNEYCLAQREIIMTSATFISYAQVFEDAVLFRALEGVENGFYIDVGAHDPNHDSVTKAFYDRGWHGINIEPVQYWYERLVKERPQDINLNLAAGNIEGALRFFEVIDSGLSTASVEYAGRHEGAGREVCEREVVMSTLNSICKKYPATEIHFLKIDVEGFETQVLQGIDLSILRPWIIVVEATEPLTTVESWHDWEPILLKSDYSFAVFDGLNRFYFASERPELENHLKAPIKSFDCRSAKEQS
jgi:FkbM family methyltransferase